MSTPSCIIMKMGENKYVMKTLQYDGDKVSTVLNKFYNSKEKAKKLFMDNKDKSWKSFNLKNGELTFFENEHDKMEYYTLEELQFILMEMRKNNVHAWDYLYMFQNGGYWAKMD